MQSKLIIFLAMVALLVIGSQAIEDSYRVKGYFYEEKRDDEVCRSKNRVELETCRDCCKKSGFNMYSFRNLDREVDCACIVLHQLE